MPYGGSIEAGPILAMLFKKKQSFECIRDFWGEFAGIHLANFTSHFPISAKTVLEERLDLPYLHVAFLL